MRWTARIAAETAAATLLALLVLYFAVRLSAGNPLAGLGAEGMVTGKAAEELRSLLGLNGGLLEGLTRYLEGLVRGLDLGYSLLYSELVSRLVANSLPYTLLPVALGSIGGYAVYILAYVALGERAHRVAAPLAYTPGFILSLPFALLEWETGRPSPLPGREPLKALFYSIIVCAVVSSRLLYTHRGGRLLRYAAIGAPVWYERLRVLRLEAPHSTVYAAVTAIEAMVEGIVVEPLLGYLGLGYLAYRAILESDIPLALAALATYTLIASLVLAVGEAAAIAADPRLAGGAYEAGA